MSKSTQTTIFIEDVETDQQDSNITVVFTTNVLDTEKGIDCHSIELLCESGTITLWLTDEQLEAITC